MTYGHLRADCLYTGISSGPNTRCRVWEAFTFIFSRMPLERRRSAHRSFVGLEPVGGQTVRPLNSIKRDQCDVRPTVTFPAVEHHRPLTGAKLYCSVTGKRGSEEHAQSRSISRASTESRTHDLVIATPTPNQLCHHTTPPLKALSDRRDRTQPNSDNTTEF